MNKISPETRVREPSSAQQADWSDEGGVPEDDFKPLTPEQAAAWRKGQVQISVWRVLGYQALLGASLGGLVAALGNWVAAKSFWYGAAAVWFPAVLMAWGMLRGKMSRMLAVFPRGSFAALVFWEGVKVLLSVLLMVAAPWVLIRVDWLALLAGLVVVIKVNGVALWWVSRAPRKVN
jgi:ATP synthase protein I